MLPARPNALVARWFDGWCRRALRRSFHGIHLYLPGGAESVAEYDAADRSAGRLYVANHASFWDVAALYFLLRRRFSPGQAVYAMVDAQQVAEHPFFRRVGGFSVDRADGRDGLAAIDYAAERLGEGSAVVVFPQGEVVPAGRRPLGFESGVGRVVERCPSAVVVPIGLRYEFWAEERPEAMLAVGREVRFDGVRVASGRREVVASCESAVTSLLSGLEDAGLAHRPGDRLLLRGRSSISRWKEAYRRG